MSYCAKPASGVCSLSKYKRYKSSIPDSVQGRKLIGSQTSRCVVTWGCGYYKNTEENTVDIAAGYPCFNVIPLALCKYPTMDLRKLQNAWVLFFCKFRSSMLILFHWISETCGAPHDISNVVPLSIPPTWWTLLYVLLLLDILACRDWIGMTTIATCLTEM